MRRAGGCGRFRWCTRALCLTACVFLLGRDAAWPQELPTGVTVSSTAGAPGTEATTPIYLASAKNSQPGGITLSLSYPADVLAFKKVESDLTESLGFTLTTKLATRDNGKTAVLELDIRYKEPGKGHVIPDGPVARLTFEIAATAKLNSQIVLQASVVAMTADVPPKALTPVKAYDGTIEVTGENVFACFFYMH